MVTNDHEGLASRYAHAREVRADVIAEEIIDIADTAEDANIARLQIDARKWYAGKVRPKVYGDKIQQDVTMDVSDKLAERLDAAKARLNDA
ncbi:hypothetical protein CU669_15140 [Paramagnetospirillum kuznetsovii]|uniref:Uncharacterized protein n=1 Tax=Paramagnetospirillum kuznetsovii TaxID=2053833 RepID=A0A364NVM0_9PROT|nr:hypothetical protein CU669_15140 [Paramagnetospirillum kuznetsovii]